MALTFENVCYALQPEGQVVLSAGLGGPLTERAFIVDGPLRV